MKIRNAALAAAGLLFWALTSYAQITALEGYVKGSDGKPLDKAVIDIVRTDIKGHWTTKTDKKGHYIYTGLQMGMYTVTLIVDGKVADAVKGIRTKPGDPILNNFDLSKISEVQAANKELQDKAITSGEIPKELTQGLTPQQAAELKKKIEDRAAGLKKKEALNKAFNDATAAMDAKNYDEAIKNYIEASTMDPAQLAVWNGLAAAYLALAKTKTGDEFDSNTQKGIETYQKSLELKDDPGIHNNLGLAYAQGKQLEKAQAELEKAVALEPASACKYYFNLGAVEANGHQYDGSTVAFQKAVAADPKCAEAYFELGNSLMAKATLKPDGTTVPVPGTVEAFQKYLDVAPTGKNVEVAKAMIEALGSKVETNYVDPNSKKSSGKKK